MEAKIMKSTVLEDYTYLGFNMTAMTFIMPFLRGAAGYGLLFCLLKYDKAEDSFEDHSQFLKRPRYASLYELDIYDYKAWANGLKKCGYATDPNYASRLINLIEVYELYSYDKDAKKSGPTQEEKELAQAEANYQHGTSMGEIHSYTSHEVVKVNGRKAVIARNGDTYESIAKEFGMRKWEIRWCNKVRKGETPSDGQTVFLRKW
jgi:hypothetical protein